jgi:hypothetical protein
MQRKFIKEILPVYGGTCSSRKAVHNWVEKFSEGRLKDADDARPGVEVAEIVKRLMCCGFRRTGKAIGQECHCWWRICREINVFFFPQVRISRILRSISVCDLFTDSPSFSCYRLSLEMSLPSAAAKLWKPH